MSRGIKKWTDERIAELQREGRGQGRHATYQPWVRISDFHSKGRTHYPYSHRTGRNHDLLSDGEYSTFVMLEWRRDNLDIREQFPLDRDLTLELAHTIGVKHPYYPRTSVPTVMTLDFLVTRFVDGKDEFHAYSVKQAQDLEDPRVIEKLELEHSFCASAGIAYDIVIKEELPMAKIRNLIWIRDAQVEAEAGEDVQAFFVDHQVRMAQDLASTSFSGTLVDYCKLYESRFSVAAGTGMRVARMLLWERSLTMDLNNRSAERAPLASFQLSALPGRLRAIGAT